MVKTKLLIQIILSCLCRRPLFWIKLIGSLYFNKVTHCLAWVSVLDLCSMSKKQVVYTQDGTTAFLSLVTLVGHQVAILVVFSHSTCSSPSPDPLHITVSSTIISTRPISSSKLDYNWASNQSEWPLHPLAALSRNTTL